MSWSGERYMDLVRDNYWPYGSMVEGESELVTCRMCYGLVASVYRTEHFEWHNPGLRPSY